ncbi:MAG: hypothetical protein PHX30_03195 [Candidatus Pacebacteria bacterium]|nr:hypothetical protein [Candidatus Paceibacterota bacterium]
MDISGIAAILLLTLIIAYSLGKKSGREKKMVYQYLGYSIFGFVAINILLYVMRNVLDVPAPALGIIYYISLYWAASVLGSLLALSRSLIRR